MRVDRIVEVDSRVEEQVAGSEVDDQVALVWVG